MLPNQTPANKEWYRDRRKRLATVASAPETFPPLLIASYCQSVLGQIYGNPWRVVWLLFLDRLSHEWERMRKNPQVDLDRPENFGFGPDSPQVELPSPTLIQSQ